MNIERIIILISRIVLGFIFFIFGMNGLLFSFLDITFLGEPPLPTEPAFLVKYWEVLLESYIFQTVKIFEVIGGALLLIGYAIPLAIVILAPIILNIFLYHILYDFIPSIPILIIISVTYGSLIWLHFSLLQKLLSRKN